MRNKQIARNRFAAHAICLPSAPIHSPMNTSILFDKIISLRWTATGTQLMKSNKELTDKVNCVLSRITGNLYYLVTYTQRTSVLSNTQHMVRRDCVTFFCRLSDSSLGTQLHRRIVIHSTRRYSLPTVDLAEGTGIQLLHQKHHCPIQRHSLQHNTLLIRLVFHVPFLSQKQ